VPAIVNHDNSADDSTRNVLNADGVGDERAVDDDSDDDSGDDNDDKRGMVQLRDQAETGGQDPRRRTAWRRAASALLGDAGGRQPGPQVEHGLRVDL
jgi:hypothetical protein